MRVGAGIHELPPLSHNPTVGLVGWRRALRLGAASAGLVESRPPSFRIQTFSFPFGARPARRLLNYATHVTDRGCSQDTPKLSRAFRQKLLMSLWIPVAAHSGCGYAARSCDPVPATMSCRLQNCWWVPLFIPNGVNTHSSYYWASSALPIRTSRCKREIRNYSNCGEGRHNLVLKST